MDRLWTPWRYDYVTGAESKGRRKGVPAKLNGWPEGQDNHCVFCNMIAAADYAISNGMDPAEADQAIYVVERGATCFVCLNAYPYGTGHVMIVPYQHTDSLAALPDDAAAEMMETMRRIERCLREVYRPNGLNFGLNLGVAAGAGIAEHIHFHSLPRWNGDTNFMTVIGETRVLPETLDVTWSKLRDSLRRISPSVETK
ncbi:HIT domain-containing protein [Granulicella sp. dw_53]|uniref:HIT family protein n=1 Tax=Granulicella sp. dw_53 TaxID=2719792 RepID=UPI001BD3A954|nr:HIT domain-containing protein [Granulicella sp. dw_53]